MDRIARCRPLLGTFVEIIVPAGQEPAIAAAFAAIAHVHARMSFHEEGSDLARLRRAPEGTVVSVDPETVAVLRLAAMLHEKTGGLFDVSVGARLVTTGFLPRPPGTDLRCTTGSAADIRILSDTDLCCDRPMLIDLGGIAKGHAVDRAIEALAAAGVTSAVVNAGGDLRVLGEETVLLRGADGELECELTLVHSALASSANLKGRRRHRGHDVSPHLGRAFTAVLVDEAVSVVADRCAVADAMTKVALADPQLAVALLAELGGAIVERPGGRQAA